MFGGIHYIYILYIYISYITLNLHVRRFWGPYRHGKKQILQGVDSPNGGVVRF